MRVALMISVALASLLLGGCGKSKDQAGPYPGESLDWYVHHKDEREAQRIWCAKEIDEGHRRQGRSQSCMLADQAAQVAWKNLVNSYHSTY